MRITCSWEIICHEQLVLKVAVLQCLAVFSTSFEMRCFSAVCALIPCSKPGVFLLANIISHETLPCREVQSCCDEFRATDFCHGTQISPSCCTFYHLWYFEVCSFASEAPFSIPPVIAKSPHPNSLFFKYRTIFCLSLFISYSICVLLHW